MKNTTYISKELQLDIECLIIQRIALLKFQLKGYEFNTEIGWTETEYQEYLKNRPNTEHIEKELKELEENLEELLGQQITTYDELKHLIKYNNQQSA